MIFYEYITVRICIVGVYHVEYNNLSKYSIICISASISGKNVLVTGASKGIGKALALEYARLGANVMVTARTEKALKEASNILQI